MKPRRVARKERSEEGGWSGEEEEMKTSLDQEKAGER